MFRCFDHIFVLICGNRKNTQYQITKSWFKIFPVLDDNWWWLKSDTFLTERTARLFLARSIFCVKPYLICWPVWMVGSGIPRVNLAPLRKAHPPAEGENGGLGGGKNKEEQHNPSHPTAFLLAPWGTRFSFPIKTWTLLQVKNILTFWFDRYLFQFVFVFSFVLVFVKR